MRREGDQVDVDCEQDQLDRHQNNDHVLAVKKNAENPEREQDRSDGQIVTKTNDHGLPPHPWPGRTLTILMEAAGVRVTCAAIFWRRTRVRWCSVSTMAPIIATSRMMPAAWKK
jgi:hypothetical protein